MNEKLKYGLVFVSPKTGETLFPKGRNDIDFRTYSLPRLGDIIRLDFELDMVGEKRGKYKRGLSFRFKVVEVERMILCTSSNVGGDIWPEIEDSPKYWVRVVPTMLRFEVTMNAIRKFYEQTKEKHSEGKRS